MKVDLIESSAGAREIAAATRRPISSSKSVIKTLAGRGGMLALNCGTGILTARALLPEGRGELAAMILWPVFLSGAFTLGLPSALIYTLRMGRRSAESLITAALLGGVVLSAIAACLGFLLLPHWLVHYPAAVVRSAQWFMISAPATILILLGRGVWEASGRFGTSSASWLLAPVTTLSGLLALLFLHHLTPITAAWVYVLSGIAPCTWVLVSLRHGISFRLRGLGAAFGDLLSYGLRSFGIDLCGSLAQYIDQALVLGMLLPAEMGTYAVALSLSRMLNVIFISTAAVIFPKAVEHTPEGSARLALRGVAGSLILAIPGAIVMMTASGFALRVLYGPEYVVANGLLRILIVEAVLSGCISVLSQPFMAIGRPGTVTILQASGLAISVPLIWVFVPIWGSEGAGLALLLSACLRAALLRYCYRSLVPPRTPLLQIAVGETGEMARRYCNLVRNFFTPASATEVI